MTMTTVPRMNPYRYLASQARTLLRADMKLQPDERATTSWLLRVEFCETSVTMGRGGFNTCFIIFGDGKRLLDFPNKILEKLDRLGRQAHVRYIVTDGKREKAFWTLAQATKYPPRKGLLIQGVGPNGTGNTIYTARSSMRGTMSWIRTK